ncbi:MAG: NAD kinase [Alphaproteobacteria bacterium]|jgi:NAD+ kinase|nr:NAD kinase [Flavobacteriaceae bacterium]MDG2007746.1 NAD kinase [Alphaproteobacteria bacterium]
MKLAFTSFPLEKNLEAKKELEKKYGTHKPEDADIIVALGGDGFVLKSLHEYLKLSKPIFGMNFGSVGFLMNSHSTENLEERIEKAQLLKLKPLIMKTINPTGQEVRALAINEVSIRREKYQAAKLKIEIDGVTRMEELVCDGVMASTAVGSTGYNYSASGPIIPLEGNVIALTAVSSYKPRHWRGGLLFNKAKIKITNINPSKRPIVAHADHIEAKDVISIEIEMADKMEIPLLLDNDHTLEDRVYSEMFGQNKT